MSSSYVAGVTSISLRDYAIGMIGILPGTLLYILLGSSAGSLVDSSSSGDNSTVRILSIVVGIVIAVLGVYSTTYYVKKEFNSILSKRQSTNAAASTDSDVESSNNKRASTAGNDSVTADEDDVEAHNENDREGDTYKNEEKHPNKA
uniref:Uncharacterized protein n=1 Tax=Ditylum brightwellii TaxID=49249 RepID=A0A7S4SGB1_9STRA